MRLPSLQKVLRQFEGVHCTGRSEGWLAHFRPFIRMAGSAPATRCKPPPCVATKDSNGQGGARATDHQEGRQ